MLFENFLHNSEEFKNSKIQKFLQNYLCWDLFLMKFQALKLQLYLEVTPEKEFPCVFCEVFKNIYFVKYLQRAAFELVRC